MRRVMVKLALAAMLLGTAPLATAAPCAGFTDVDDTSAFCGNVAWLKNRAITLGCTSTTLYCPTGTVNRLAMAAFMNRLGTALTPVQLQVDVAPGVIDPDISPVVCQTTDFVAEDFARVAYADARFGATASGDLGLAVDLVMSLDQGASWSMLNLAPNRGFVPANQWGSFTDLGFAVLDAEQTARWGLRISRAGLAGAADLTASGCQLRVRLLGLDEAAPVVLKVTATIANASEVGPSHGQFTVTRSGSKAAALPVQFALGGTAANCADYACIASIVIPAGQAAVQVPVTVLQDTPAESTESVVLTLTPGAGYVIATPSATVTIANGPAPVNAGPTVNAGTDQAIVLPALANLSGGATDDGFPNPPHALTLAWTKQSGPGTVTFGNVSAPVTTASFSVDGVYVLRLTANDSALSAFDEVQITVDPASTLVAPPIDPTVPTTLVDSTEFLYTGPSPVQTGVTVGTIDAKRVAVLRGKVTTRAGAPIAGVTVSVLGQPAFGQTQTRSDGRFDMAVNGGGTLTVDYRAPGLLPAQRTVKVPWLDFVPVPDVAMIALDTAVSAVAANAGAMQVHQGTQQTDSSGARRATILFPAGTGATMQLPGGGSQVLTSLNVRATEYTVGVRGPQAMPGELPPTSGYTYAVELSVDEAIAAGATQVDFSQPLPFYLDNFLGFPAGTQVPVGYYDRRKARWIAAPDGRVLKVISIGGGAANLDVTGDDVADDPATVLAPLGITFAERQSLATLYAAGKSLWRVSVEHFSPWDLNMATRIIAPGAVPPNTSGLDTEQNVDQCVEEVPVASLVECQNQTLGQRIGIAGTPYTLNYRSDRVPGRLSAFDFGVELSGAAPPASLKRIDLVAHVAGQEFPRTFSAAPNQRIDLSWDGKDAYGRTVQGRQALSGRFSYIYDAVYVAPGGANPQSFALPGGGTVFGTIVARAEEGRSAAFAGRLGVMDARGIGAGGWTLSPHHAYDPGGGVLYLGDGRRTSAGAIPYVAQRVIGGGAQLNGEGIPATDADFGLLIGVAVAPDGTTYVADGTRHRVRRIDPNGIVTTFAGTGTQGSGGDGGLATAAQLNTPGYLALGPDGSLYIATAGRVRRVDPTGIITTFAGGGAQLNVFGIPATEAQIAFPLGIKVAPDGTVFLVSAPERVLRVGTDGLLNLVAGGGAIGSSSAPPHDVLATDAKLSPVWGGLGLDAQGNLFVSFNQHVARIDPGGMLTVVVGPLSGQSNNQDDGIPALDAELGTPEDVLIAANGDLLIVDSGWEKVRAVDAAGFIRTIVGGGSVLPSAGGTNPPGEATRVSPIRAAVAPDGSLRVVDSRTGVGRRQAVLKVRSQMPAFQDAPFNIPSPDGHLVYQFDSRGRHLRTLHALTAATLVEFVYDSAGRLVQVVEKTGGTDNVTAIQRNASGNPTAIVAPFGQVTQLQTDANGFVSQVVDPAGETFAMLYNAGGLMTSFTMPGNRTSTYQYGARGRLTRADVPGGAFTSLARSDLPVGHDVTRTSALGRTSHHVVENRPAGEQRLTTTTPDNAQTVTDVREDGTQSTTLADGTIATRVTSPDPRFGMLAPFTASATTRLPSNLQSSEAGTRTVTLSDPANLLSVVSLVDTVTIGTRTTRSTYTGATRTNVITTPANRTTTTVLDALGRVVSRQVPGLTPTTYAYDARGRASSVTTGSRSVSLAFNPQGFLQSVTDGGLVTQYTHDLNGRITSKSLAGINVAGFGYDTAGDLVSIVPPGRPPHALAYDGRGALASVTPPPAPGSGPTSFTYNTDSQLTLVSRPGGEQVAFAYDTAGRLGSIALTSPGLAATSTTFGYDATGRNTTVTGPGAQTVTHAYDGPLVTSTTWAGPFAASASWTYDTAFRVASEVVPGSGSIAFAYDADDLITGVGALSIARSAQHGMPTSMTLGALVETYTYGSLGELTGQALANAGSPVFAATFARDAGGRVVQRQETIGGVTDTLVYAYDPLGQLVQVTRNAVVTETYAYDPNGNRTSATLGGVAVASTYDAQDRVVSAGTTTFVHSGAGKLQQRAAPGGTTAYRYDALGNLIDVALPGGPTVAYRVDGWDRRVQKLVNGTLVAQYLHATGSIAAELDAAGAVVSRFLYAGGVAPVAMIKGGVTYRVVADGNASVRLVVNSATGAIAQRLDYDAFGRVVLDTNPGFQPFGFAGGLYDRDTGLVRIGARDYDAVTGRWTNRDPIGVRGGDTNQYRYSRNDPVNRMDPSGLVTLDEAIDFAAGFVEEAMPPPQLQLLNPGVAFAVATDALSRTLQSALGYPPVGESVYDRLTDRLDVPGVDRDSAAYALGEFTADIAPICTLGAGLISSAAKAGLKAATNAVKKQLRERAAQRAREEAEQLAKAKAERAAAEARAKKLKYYDDNIRAEPVKTDRVKDSPGYVKPKVS